MSEHKFKEFLQSRQWGHAPDMDFIEDVMHDRQFLHVKSWEELETYLQDHNATAEILSAAKSVWQLHENVAEKGR
jgi:hypothetical protein